MTENSIDKPSESTHMLSEDDKGEGNLKKDLNENLNDLAFKSDSSINGSIDSVEYKQNVSEDITTSESETSESLDNSVDKLNETIAYQEKRIEENAARIRYLEENRISLQQINKDLNTKLECVSGSI